MAKKPKKSVPIAPCGRIKKCDCCILDAEPNQLVTLMRYCGFPVVTSKMVTHHIASVFKKERMFVTAEGVTCYCGDAEENLIVLMDDFQPKKKSKRALHAEKVLPEPDGLIRDPGFEM